MVVRVACRPRVAIPPSCLNYPTRALSASKRPATTPQRLTIPTRRVFSNTTPSQSWLLPKRKLTHKDPKGRPRMCTGGSTRGTTVIWGDYGLRMRDHDRRISAAQFRNGEDVIRRRLRGMNFRLFTRLHTGTAVYTKGNESRMGTGKGSFDHWASRVPVSRVVFELKADVHEQVVRDAFRLAANKMPGLYEFVKRGDPPVMGITKLAPHMAESDIKRPRKRLPGEEKGHRLPGANESPLSTGNPGPAPGQTF